MIRREVEEGGLRATPTILLWVLVGLPLWWGTGAALKWSINFAVSNLDFLAANRAWLETFGFFGMVPGGAALLLVVWPVLDSLDVKLWRRFPALRDPKL